MKELAKYMLPIRRLHIVLSCAEPPSVRSRLEVSPRYRLPWVTKVCAKRQ